MPGEIKRAAEILKGYRGRDPVEIVSHMDVDGICAAALLSKALAREGIEHRVKFVRMLYREVVEELDPAPLTLFTDLGSSQLLNLREKYRHSQVIVCDHHPPETGEGWEGLLHLNAHLMGMDGTREISGAGMAFLLARELNPSNSDLSALAVVGAVGDVQNVWGRLVGKNREILEEAVGAGKVVREMDLQLYGRHSRTLLQALEGLSDPPIPGITHSSEGCLELVRSLGIPVKGENGWRKPADLTPEEKQKLAGALISLALSTVPTEFSRFVPGLIVGEVYTLKGESPELRDAGEFATCLNSTARHEQPVIGLEVAKGDRGPYRSAMLNLLRYHRSSLARGMELIETGGVKLGERGYLQYFDATGVVKETFTGTLAGLSLSSGRVDPFKPVVGMVRNGGKVKVSARCSRLLFLKGLDLSSCLRRAAGSVGGEGGGHPVAGGAQVPEERVEEFLRVLEERMLEGMATSIP
ncbi:MAG: DHH family phosphoesterase [Candidatus Hadarchaeales archaeon]